MVATLTVSAVRNALLQAGGQPGQDGAPSSSAAGILFHRVMSELLDPDSDCRLSAALRNLDPELPGWKSHLKRYAYEQLLGPALTRQAAALQSQGENVLHLWTAVQEACEFLCDLWWEITERGRRMVDQRQWLSAEQKCVCRLHRPNWKEPVEILGQPDAILRVPRKREWCVLEWKLGKASPEVDLAQACLYHMILGELSASVGQSALALVSFRPRIDEISFSANQLLSVRDRLFDLIGRQAGVVDVPSPRNLPRNLDEAVRIPSENKSTVMPPVAPDYDPTDELGKKLLRVLRQFGAPCRQIKPPVIGPTFVRFFLFPESRIPQRKVLSQADQLHLHLALPAAPNMNVIDGAITVDLPREDRVSIPFSAVEPHLPEPDPQFGSSQIPVGMDLNGQWTFCDLAASESAHLLVVGTPGSGKSQWLRVALMSLLRTNTPESLQLLLIDPKQNAFTFAQSSPCLRRPIVVPDGDHDVSEILDELIREMERRNALFAQVNAQSLSKYHQLTRQTLPRIVCLCDEFADLLLHAEAVQGRAARKEIETAFQRLVSKGRAAGVHLILATQYPTRKIVTTAIQASIGAKISLRVSSPLESRVALDQSGAERLLGNGDLLYKCLGDPIRLQGAWLPEHEEQLADASPGGVFALCGG